MIRINLLPESYRRAERTSPKVFAAALVGVLEVDDRGFVPEFSVFATNPFES